MTSQHPRPDPLAIAGQVIVSAGNILVAAGFTREEIRSFFLQAADQLADADEAQVADSGTARGLKAEFARTDAVRQLAAGCGRAQDANASLRDRFDLAMRIIPLVAEAQHWLRRAATQAGLSVIADRRQHHPETAEAALVFEDYEDCYAPALDHLGALLEDLARADDDEAVAFLLQTMTDQGVTITHALGQTIQGALDAMAARRHIR